MTDKKFIAYFDYLGFADFIQNNDLDYQKRIMANIFRDIESALAGGEIVEANHGYIADLSKNKVNCINFSDTIIFWTNDDSEESFSDIMKVTHYFNWQTNLHFFPARGCLTLGELEGVDFKHANDNGGTYNINSVYGKGLVRAHLVAESQEWAGTVIDPDIIEIINLWDSGQGLLDEMTVDYDVPFKHSSVAVRTFRLIKGSLNEESFINCSTHIRSNFSDHNKNSQIASVQTKLKNTIDFLESFKDKG